MCHKWARNVNTDNIPSAACSDRQLMYDLIANHSAIRYDTIEEFNVDSKAEYTA